MKLNGLKAVVSAKFFEAKNPTTLLRSFEGFYSPFIPLLQGLGVFWRSRIIPYLFIFFLLKLMPLQSATLYNACDCGRLGDNIVNYIKAKYLSLKYKIPLELKPFPYADQLMLSCLETPLSRTNNKPYRISEEKQLKSIVPNAQYEISYYTQINNWDDNIIPGNNCKNDIEVWKDLRTNTALMAELNRMIKPKQPYPSKIPSGMTSIAVHIRKPSEGRDDPLKSVQNYDPKDFVKEFSVTQIQKLWFITNDTGFPLKFPPDYFYIQQIQFLIDELDDHPLYIYIFTDHTDPRGLANIIRSSLRLRGDIVIDYSKEFDCKKHVIEDLFFMADFDYLIRPNSNFSQIAGLIGKHKKIISPKSAKWYLNKNNEYCLYIDEVYITKTDQ